MTTLVIPSGKQIATYTNSAVTLFDAVTNDPFYLCDYIPGLGSTTSRSYPCRIDAAASGAVWQGGRFYGNILESAARRTIYNQAFDGFNSALMLPRNGISLTVRDAVFGIAGNRNTGYIDGIRTSGAGNTLIEDCEFYQCRDDAFECDSGGNVTMRRIFVEDTYVWISATGSGSNRQIRAENCLVRVHRWRELEPGQVVSGRTEFQCGPFFKSGGTASFSPFWTLINVTMAVPREYAGDPGYVRTISALRKMSTTNCTLLSYEGALTNDNGLRNEFLAAGWTIVEGPAAQAEWEAQKAAWFGATTPPPIQVQTLTSPATLRVNVENVAVRPSILSEAVVINSSALGQTSFTSGSVAPSAGSNRCAVLMVSTKANGDASLANIAASWNGVSMNRLANATFGLSANPGSAIFYLRGVEMPTSAGTITVSSTLMSGCYARLIQFDGVNQDAPFGVPVASNPNSSVLWTASTVNIQQANSWMLSVATANGTAGGFTLSNGTEKHDVDVGTVLGASAATDDVNASGDRQHRYDIVNSRRLAVVGVEMFAAVPPGTNLLVGGRDLTDAAWIHTNTTPTADTWSSPLGAGGDTLTSDTTSSETAQAYANWGAGAYNLSAYVNKGGSHRWVRMRMASISVWFDVIDGVVGTNSGATSAQVIDAGTAWRIEIIGSPGAGSAQVRFNFVNGDNSTTEVSAAAVQLDGILLTSGATLRDYPV